MNCIAPLLLVLLVAGCAPPADVPVSLSWYTSEVPCVDSVAEWDAPEDLVLFSYKAKERDFWVYRAGGVLGDGGALSVNCTDDLVLTYALTE